ncbi:MAG: hypothetical protein IJB33_07975 [Akkermansia sp.]|nr:hypothetical protein [Akkermansia sp.]
MKAHLRVEMVPAVEYCSQMFLVKSQACVYQVPLIWIASGRVATGVTFLTYPLSGPVFILADVPATVV